MPAEIDDKTFEQSMAEMAMAALKSKAPALTDYLMGFQLVERGEDDTKAMGFFAFKVGEQWVYSPVFFLSGEVKGDELMYVKREDKMLPLNEGWINYLIKKRSFQLGETQDKNREILGIGSPDLAGLTRRPSSAKAAADAEKMVLESIANSISAGPEKVASWAEDVIDHFRGMKLTEYPEVLRLPKIAAKHGLTAGLLRDCVDRPELGKAVFAFYDPEEFVDEATKVSNKTSADQIYSPPKPVMVLDSTNVEKDRGRAKFLSTEDKQQIMRGNTVVVDGRPEEAKRKVYEYQSSLTLENPTDGGMYDMLTSDGGMKKVLILVPRVIGLGAAREVRIVIDTESGAFKFLPTLNIYVAHQYSHAEFKEALEDIGSSVSSGAFSARDDGDSVVVDLGEKEYTIIGPNGQAVIPFSVQRKIEDVDGKTSLFVSLCHPDIAISDLIGQQFRDHNKPNAYENKDGGPFSVSMPFSGVLYDDRGILDINQDGTSRSMTSPSNSWDLSSNMRIVLTDKQLKGPVANGQTLIVPKNSGYRVLKVKKAKSEIDPGTTADLFLGIEKSGAERVKIYSDGIAKHITCSEWTKVASCEREALQILIGDLGVSESDARIMYKEASELKTAEQVRFFVGQVKTAAPFDSVLNQSTGRDPFIDANIQDSQGEILFAPREYQSERNDDVYRHFKDENNYDAVYKKDIDRINQAASTGQKDVFDAAALGALINVHNVGDTVEGYFGDMIQALDKLGRTLFLMYWHREDMQERYGKQDLRDLEDNVKSTFESLGDVVLDLKKKSPVDVDAFGRGILNTGPKS